MLGHELITTEFCAMQFMNMRSKTLKLKKMAVVFQTTFSWMKCISLAISLKFVPRVPVNNSPALVQIMAWRRPGDKQWFEPMVIRSSMHICVTQPRWVITSLPLTCGLDKVKLGHRLITICDTHIPMKIIFTIPKPTSCHQTLFTQTSNNWLLNASYFDHSKNFSKHTFW